MARRRARAQARSRANSAWRARADVTARFTLHPYGSDVQLRTPAGDADVALAVPGRHMVSNALAAAAAAHSAGVPLAAIVTRTASFSRDARTIGGAHRCKWRARDRRQLQREPDSVRAAIDVLAHAAGTRWLALGDMGEVGRAGSGLSSRDRRIRACGAASIDWPRWVSPRRAAAAAFGRGGAAFPDVDALAVSRRGRDAARRHGARQGIALHADGARRCGTYR